MHSPTITPAPRKQITAVAGPEPPTGGRLGLGRVGIDTKRDQ